MSNGTTNLQGASDLWTSLDKLPDSLRLVLWVCPRPETTK